MQCACVWVDSRSARTLDRCTFCHVTPLHTHTHGHTHALFARCQEVNKSVWPVCGVPVIPNTHCCIPVHPSRHFRFFTDIPHLFSMATTFHLTHASFGLPLPPRGGTASWRTLFFFLLPSFSPSFRLETLLTSRVLYVTTKVYDLSSCLYWVWVFVSLLLSCLSRLLSAIYVCVFARVHVSCFFVTFCL